MEYIDFISTHHKSTKRDYIERVVSNDKAKCAVIAKKFDREYWDGPRQYGFGGYTYDGRWRSVAEEIAKHYQLKSGDKVLDVGCGKGFLIYELTQVVPGIMVKGVDISRYAIENSKEEIRADLVQGLAQELPYEDESFDLVISINTLHNLYIYDLKKALIEIERVKKNNAYLVVESYRNESEKVNMLYWQLTCECFFTPKEWEWIYEEYGYSGDYSFIYFE